MSKKPSDNQIDIEKVAKRPRPVGANPKVSELPTTNNMYMGSYVLDPQGSFSLSDMVNVFSIFTQEEIIAIMRALTMRISPQKFERLPKEVRKHFMLHARNGEITRPNSR